MTFLSDSKMLNLRGRYFVTAFLRMMEQREGILVSPHKNCSNIFKITLSDGKNSVVHGYKTLWI